MQLEIGCKRQWQKVIVYHGSPELNVVSKLEDRYNIENKTNFQGKVLSVMQITDNGKVFADFDKFQSWAWS